MIIKKMILMISTIGYNVNNDDNRNIENPPKYKE